MSSQLNIDYKKDKSNIFLIIIRTALGITKLHMLSQYQGLFRLEN